MTSAAPAIPAGHKRQWLRCRTCGEVSYYDFVPYSFSNPVSVLPCRHGVSEKDMGADRITSTEAKAALRRRA